MYNQKLENIINVSLSATEDEKKHSGILSSATSGDGERWELIVKMAADSDYLFSKYEGIVIDRLFSNYAIVEIDEELLEKFSQETGVEYIEFPKRIYYGIQSVLQETCVNNVRGVDNPYMLYGDGVIVAIVDSGIDYFDREFISADNKSRILNILDLDNEIKREYSNSEINELIENNVKNVAADISGHGTNVAKLACGNSGIASRADIIAVKMSETNRGFSKTTSLMRGIDYCVRKAIEYRKPVVINISYGNNYGDHSGNTLLEQYINAVASLWKCSICIGAGNEGVSDVHTCGRLYDDTEQFIELAVTERQTGFDIQIWKNYWDSFNVELIAPDGTNLGMIKRGGIVERKETAQTALLCLYGEPSPYNQKQEIFIDFIPKNAYIDSGIWIIRLIPERISQGSYDAWLPADISVNNGTGFVNADNRFTITVPSTALAAVSVGAYNGMSGVVAGFSGRGYVSRRNINANPQPGVITSGDTIIGVKPDIVAPGVNVRTGNTTSVSGTSFAVPIVSGAAALLMEWGIVKGNDAYLYGEKLKAYLIKGAVQLPTFGERPDINTGWGALCVSDSIPATGMR